MKAQVFFVLACLFAVHILPVQSQESLFTPYERLYTVCYNPETNPFAPFGDLCSWTDGETTLRQETTGQYISELVISPDGTKIAFLTLPEELVQDMQNGNYPIYVTSGFVFEEDDTLAEIWRSAYQWGQYSTNVGILDLETSEFLIVAEQNIPPEADEWSHRQRTQPVWSPDSTQFAWIDTGGNILRYDTRTESVELVAERQPIGWCDAGQCSFSGLIGWGDVIMYGSFNAGVYPDDVDSSFGTLLFTYDESGVMTSNPITYITNYEDRYTAIRIAHYEDQWRIAIHYLNLGWVLYDPFSDTYTHVDDIPYLQSITGEGWQGYLVDTVAYPERYEWVAGELLPDDFNFHMPTTMDPAGTPLWHTADGLSRIIDGEFQPLAFATDTTLVANQAVWMPMIWQLDGEDTLIEKTVNP